MIDSGNRTREEDPLLRYAYVPVETKKVHAMRFEGYINDLPHHFARFIMGTLIGSSMKLEQVRIITARDVDKNPLSIVDCKLGEWIVVDCKTDRVQVMSDEDFRSIHCRVKDLSLE